MKKTIATLEQEPPEIIELKVPQHFVYCGHTGKALIIDAEIVCARCYDAEHAPSDVVPEHRLDRRGFCSRCQATNHTYVLVASGVSVCGRCFDEKYGLDSGRPTEDLVVLSDGVVASPWRKSETDGNFYRCWRDRDGILRSEVREEQP